MIDFAILKECGSTNERLKEIFTATLPSNIKELKEEEQTKLNRDVDLRKRWEERIGNRIQEKIGFNLRNNEIYSAVDLAMDSVPINKQTVPLMLYAQGHLDAGQIAKSMTTSGFSQYVSKDDKGDPKVDLPKFYETTINAVRSVIARRLAAQSNKFSNLFPLYKYESRSTSLVGKLRADVMSQIVDIMADNYDYRHHDVQCFRDILMYSHVVDFISCAWEKDCQWRKKDVADGLEAESDKYDEVIVKEGISFTNSHPTRTFADNSYPLSSINTNTGVSWIGYWDVKRYGEVKDDVRFWNRDKINFGNFTVEMFNSYSLYFSQYYCTIAAPTCNWECGAPGDAAAANDRKNQFSLYSTSEADTGMFFTVYFEKFTPKDNDVGTYPYPLWARFVVAGDNTVIFAEFLPSTPAAYGGYNENDNRQLNISVAHELMGFQDQLTNLLSYLLLVMQANNLRVMLIDTDTAGPEQVKAFREQMKGANAYTGTTVLEVSRSKMQDLGVDPTKIITLVETKSVALDVIFRAIAQLVNLMERMMALSPQEQGQPAPREISATETNLIAGTTESVASFISDSFDELRAARKRILYESYMALGNQKFRVPAMQRYSRSVITAAGLMAEDGELENGNVPMGQQSDVMRYTVIGSKQKLEHDYIFTSRDGAERPTNTQAAQTLVQLLNVLKDPAIMKAMPREQFYEIVNEIFRLSGTGVDTKLSVEEGDSQMMMEGPSPEEQQAQQAQQQFLEQLAEEIKKNTQDITAIQQMIQQFVGGQQPQPLAAAA